MSLLCCFRIRKVSPLSPQASTPEAELPARPAPARLSNIPYSSVPSRVRPAAAAASPPEAPSRIQTPMKQSTVDLSSLEVEDSDDGNDGGLGGARYSSTSTLEVLKAKFIRRLSQLSEHSSGSRHTPRSEGELARRAELRRLRQKRIEEELKDEQEAEKKTFPHDHRSSFGHHGGQLPRGGPRDTIEFGVADHEGDKSVRASLHGVQELSRGAEEAIALPGRRRSLSNVGSHQRNSSTDNKSLREYKSLPDMPSSPRLQPVYLPSVYSSNSIASWRLSYSASNIVGSLKQSMESTPNGPIKEPIEEIECESPSAFTLKPGDHEQALSRNVDTKSGKVVAQVASKQEPNDVSDLTSPEFETAATTFDMGKSDSAQTSTGRQSPLDMWLQIQGLELSRCSSSDPCHGMTDSGDETKAVVKSPSTRRHQPSAMFSSLPETSETPELSVGRRVPSPEFSTQGAASGAGLAPVPKDKWEIREITDHTSEEDLGIYTQQRKSISSHYTTQSSNPRSPPPLSVTMTPSGVMYRGIYITHPTPDRPPSSGRSSSNDGSDTSSYKTALAEASRLHPVIEVNDRYLRRPTDETLSSMLSETESFKQREVELLSVAKRFAGTYTGRFKGSHTVSKFREEFDTTRKTKPAILSKLHLPKMSTSIRKKNEKTVSPHQDTHRNCVAAALDASQTAAAGPNASLVHRNNVKHPSGQRAFGIPESTTNIWQRAVRLEADRREVLRRDREKFHASSKTDLYTGERPQSTPVDKPPNPVVRVTRVSSSSEIRLPLRTSTPPKAWARWPSHTRAVRNGPAQQHDSIRPKDFAVAYGSTGETKWPSNKDQWQVASAEPKERSESLSGKVSKAIRKSIARIMPSSDGNIGSNPSLAVDARRRRADGYLEYPELELLPMAGGYKELEALERQIDHIKRPSEAHPTPHPSPNRSPKVPLGQRLADEVHRFQHGDRAESPEADELRLTTLKLPKLVTPAGKNLATPRVISEVTTHFATPKSHMSYEDCVPTHMLNDEGSSKSNDSVNVKRSMSNVEHRTSGQPKYGTWSGRTKAEPVLRKSTHEFGVVLEELLARERDKAMDAGMRRDDAKSPEESTPTTMHH